MRHKPTPPDYALWAALPMAQTSQVEGRLRLILNRSRNRWAVTHKAWGLAAALALGIAVTIATMGTVPSVIPPSLPDVKTLHYAVADLGANFGDNRSPTNYLNDSGEVLGVSEPENTLIGKEIIGQTGIWDAGQQWTPLSLNRAETRIDPAAFTSQGQFIGLSFYQHNLPHWIVGDRSSHTYFRNTAVYRQLKAAGSELSDLKAINDAGDILLDGDQKTSHGRAFLWRNNRLILLNPLHGSGWPGVTAEGLNNSGWAVGASGSHAVLWKDSAPIDLGVLPGYDGSMGTKINALGDVAGNLYHVDAIVRSPLSGQRTQAFFWHTGKMQEIGPPPKMQYTEPMGINDAGQVIGLSLRPLPVRDPLHPHEYTILSAAFLWQNGQTYNLQQFLPTESEWQIQRADSINNKGQIIAVASHNRPPFGDRTVLLTPQP